MYTAEEARKHTAEAIKRKTKQQMLEIKMEVEKAIDIGEYSMYFSQKIADENLKTLEALGYKTYATTETMYRVYWPKPM